MRPGITDDLQRHATDLGRFAARRAVINGSQRQKAARLSSILGLPSLSSQSGRIVIVSAAVWSWRTSLVRLPWNQNRLASVKLFESPAPTWYYEHGNAMISLRSTPHWKVFNCKNRKSFHEDAGTSSLRGLRISID
jgi:hypothetical protein